MRNLTSHWHNVTKCHMKEGVKKVSRIQIAPNWRQSRSYQTLCSSFLDFRCYAWVLVTNEKNVFTRKWPSLVAKKRKNYALTKNKSLVGSTTGANFFYLDFLLDVVIQHFGGPIWCQRRSTYMSKKNYIHMYIYIYIITFLKSFLLSEIMKLLVKKIPQEKH